VGFGSGASCDITLNTALTPEQREIYQNPDLIREILNQSKNIVLIGLSSDPSKASYFVASYLQSEGYHIIPVTPRAGKILGETCYSSLKDVPIPIDLVDVFRPAREVPAIVDEAIAVSAKALWTQLRIIDFEAAERARVAGLKVVMDKCVKMEHGRYQGGLHWAGMNTEIITAKRKLTV
jgi:predicted CoA-binding protein